ncbi:MAG: PadR family transcriptional regulator [Actinomycetota bacterium]
MKKLTTTSYAMLAHLAVRPWSAYELTQQMTRGFDLVWPRAESGIYQELKNLEAHGLAASTPEPSGRRSRTVYSITRRGRHAFTAWLERPSKRPQFESEALIRVFFAEHGSKEDLQATLEGFTAYGRAVKQRLLTQIGAYLDEGEPFPERWHVIALGAGFLLELADACERWARWAQDETKKWPSTGSVAASRGERLLKRHLRRYGAPDF